MLAGPDIPTHWLLLQWDRKLNAEFIALAGQTFQHGTVVPLNGLKVCCLCFFSRLLSVAFIGTPLVVPKPKHAGYFVKRLANAVVLCCTQHLIVIHRLANMHVNTQEHHITPHRT